MKEQELITKLKQIKPLPRKAWQERTLAILESLPENVTAHGINRTSSNSLFYFLNKTIVNVKVTTGVVIATAVILISGSMVTVYASESAKPGDLLFPIDLLVENVQRSFISEPVAKAEFEIKVLDERVQELKTLSSTNDKINSATAVGEIDAQQIRLQDRLQEMDALRVQDKLQTQEQLKVLEQLKTQTKLNESTLNQVQEELKLNGNTNTQNSLNQVQLEYSKQVGEQINGFEQSTGVSVQEAEQNSGTETQIQNQNQINNTTTPGNGNGNGAPTTAPNNNLQQNGGTTQQGKN